MYFFYTPLDQDSRLQLLQRHDANALFHLIDTNRAHLRRWLTWERQTQSAHDCEQFITSRLRITAENGGFTAALWHQEQLAGLIELQKISWIDRRSAIGYWLGKTFQGHGLMTAACRAVVDYGFDTLGLNRIEIEAAAGNKRSRAIPERLGFHQDGILRQYQQVNGHYLDLVVYSMLSAEWRASI